MNKKKSCSSIFGLELNAIGFDDIDDIEKYIVENCYHTGSRVFGVSGNDSDYDYICTAPMYNNILNTARRESKIYREGDYFKSIYITLGGKVFNLICLNRIDLDAWVLATETIVAMCKNDLRDLVKSKVDRVALFESLRVQFKVIYTRDLRSEKNKLNTPEFVKKMMDQRKLIDKIDKLEG